MKTPVLEYLFNKFGQTFFTEHLLWMLLNIKLHQRVNSIQTNFPFLNPLKASEKQIFLDVFWGFIGMK